MPSLNTYRTKLNNRIENFKIKSSQLDTNKKKLKELEDKINSLKNIGEVFKESAVSSQDFLSNYLTELVTDAIKTVFPERDLTFRITFVTTRDTQCTVSLEEGDKTLSLFDSEGYGVLDIISVVLRAAYIILDKSEKIMILDEPFRNLSVDRHDLAAKMLYNLSHKLKMQIIINTHLIGIEDVADKCITITRTKKGVKIA